MSYCKKTHYTYACGHPLTWYTYCNEPTRHENSQVLNQQSFESTPPTQQRRGTTNGGTIMSHCGQSLCAPGVYRYYCCSCPRIPNVVNQMVLAYVPAVSVFLNAQNFPAHTFHTVHGPVEHVYCQSCQAALPTV